MCHYFLGDFCHIVFVREEPVGNWQQGFIGDEGTAD
jgi:hypothetical protein